MERKMRFTKDREKRKRILELIERNNGYCPSSQINSIENICPCQKMMENGECICGLYERQENYEQG